MIIRKKRMIKLKWMIINKLLLKFKDCIQCFFSRDLQFNEIEGIDDDAFKSLESLIDL